MRSSRQHRSRPKRRSSSHHLCGLVAHGAILLFVAAYSCKCTPHTSVADAAGQSSKTSIFRYENGNGIYENDFDGVVGERRNRLQIHREKQIRALLHENEGEVEPSTPSDEVEQQDPDPSSVDKTRSLSHGVKGPRKDKIDVIEGDDLVAMGDKTENKKMGKSGKASEHGYDGCECVEYELPSGKSSKGSGKSGKKGGNSKGSKSEGSNARVYHDSNLERFRALLSDEKRDEQIEGQEPDEGHENLLGRTGTRKSKIENTDDLIAMASWNDEHGHKKHGHKKKKKKHFDEPDEEAVCVRWECIPEIM
jgi:hypothetical protein